MTDVKTSQVEGAAPVSTRVRLDYLDGVRGLAALFVVLHHAHAEMEYRYPHDLSKILHLTKFLSWGHFSVAAFIVLSGYCLMLPVARSADGRLRGGFLDYIKRRARRILPPYYVTMGFCLLMIALIPSVRYATSPNWDHPLVGLRPDILISHLLLAHNLSDAWYYRIDVPMWSVATEWQIYFIFPALLLPVWRRAGIVPLIAIALAVGWAPHLLLPKGNNFDEACFWYVGLFAEGMAGAVIGFSKAPAMAKLRERVRWEWVSAATWLALLGLGLVLSAHKMEKDARWLTDPIVGLAMTSLLIYCTKTATVGRPARGVNLLSLFAAPAVVTLGTFSYSLYLIHYPLIALSNTAMAAAHVAPMTNFTLSYLVVVPAVVGFAYLFFRIFERPFMPGHLRTPAETAAAAVISPAP